MQPAHASRLKIFEELLKGKLDISWDDYIEKERVEIWVCPSFFRTRGGVKVIPLETELSLPDPRPSDYGRNLGTIDLIDIDWKEYGKYLISITEKRVELPIEDIGEAEDTVLSSVYESDVWSVESVSSCEQATEPNEDGTTATEGLQNAAFDSDITSNLRSRRQHTECFQSIIGRKQSEILSPSTDARSSEFNMIQSTLPPEFGENTLLVENSDSNPTITSGSGESPVPVERIYRWFPSSESDGDQSQESQIVSRESFGSEREPLNGDAGALKRESSWEGRTGKVSFDEMNGEDSFTSGKELKNSLTEIMFFIQECNGGYMDQEMIDILTMIDDIREDSGDDDFL